MIKYKFVNNLILTIVGIVLPEFFTILYCFNHDSDFRYNLQYVVGFVSLVCSVILLNSSSNGLKESKSKEKIARIIFVLIALSFIVYLSVGLFIQFMVSNISIG
jgi:hypothetical protein